MPNTQHYSHKIKQKLKALCRRSAAVVASWLNDKTAHITTRNWKLALTVFCLLMITASVLCAIPEPTRHNTGIQELSMTVHMPALVRPQPKRNRSRLPSSLRSFRGQLDSMQSTPAGRYYLDSLKRARPGLLDSLQQVEELYHESLLTSKN